MNPEYENDFNELFPHLPDEMKEFKESLPCKIRKSKNYNKNRYLIIDGFSGAEKIIEADSAEEAIGKSGFSSIKKALQICDPILEE